MITQMRLSPGQTVTANRTYVADQTGLVENVDTIDVGPLLAAGGTPLVTPAKLHIMVAPRQVLHFDSASHTADENGLIRDVPYDTAYGLIRDAKNPARPATEDEAALAGDEITDADLQAMGAASDAIFLALYEKFSPIAIVDTGEVTGQHDDMIFAVMQGNTELARGTVSELQAMDVPTRPLPTSAGLEMTGPAVTPTTAQPATPPAADDDASDAAPHDGDPLPETATEAAE